MSTEYCLIPEDGLCNENRTASISVHLFTVNMHSSMDESETFEHNIIYN
jgi:hypothetical protein